MAKGKGKKILTGGGPEIKLDSTQPIVENNPPVDFSKYKSIDDPTNVSSENTGEPGMIKFLTSGNAFSQPAEHEPVNPLSDSTIDSIKTAQDKIGMRNNLINASAASMNPLTPEEKVNDNIDNKMLQGMISGDFDDTLSGQKFNAAQVNSSIANSGVGNQKIIDLSQQAMDNPDLMSELSQSDINNISTDLTDAYNYGDPDFDRKLAQLSSLMNKPNYGEPAIERLGLSDYYPDMGNPIRVGGYSGSIVGNNDIYVAQGAVFPHAILDARKRALEKAAAKKAELKDKLFEMATVQGAYPYQQQLNNETMNFLSKYGEKVNYNWDELKPGNGKVAMDYWNGVKKLQTLGRATTEIHAKAEQLFKDMTSDGKMHVSPEQQRLISDWYGGRFKMNEVLESPEKEKEFYDLAKKMKAYDNVSYYSQEASKVLKAAADKMPLKIKEGLDINDPKIAKAYADLYAAKQTNDYDMYTKALLTFVDDDRIDIAAKGLLDQHRFAIPGNEDQKLDYVKRQVMSYLGKQLDIDEKIQGVYNRERLAMQRQEHDWKKEDRITPYQNIYNNYNDEGNKTIMAQAIARGDYKLANEQLENQVGGKIINAYKEEKGADGKMKKVIDLNAPLTLDLGYNPTSKDEFKTSANNLYHPTRVKEIINKTGNDDLINLYKTTGDVELYAKPSNKSLRFSIRDKNGDLQYVSQNYVRSNPNWRNEAIPISVDPVEVYAKIQKKDKFGKTYYEEVKLPSSRDVTKLDQNGIAEKDSKLRSQYGMLNSAMKQGDETYKVNEGSDAEVIPDFNP